MKKWWFGERKYIDEEKIEFKKRRKSELRFLIESGNEQGYIDYIRKYKPDIGPDELEGLIDLFHAERKRHPNDY
jgi:hypothetical protein